MVAHYIATNNVVAITPGKWQAKSNDLSKEFRQNVVPYISKLTWYRNSRDVFEIWLADGISYYLIDKNIHNSKYITNICKLNTALSSTEAEFAYQEGMILFGTNIRSIIDKCNIHKNIMYRTAIKKSMYIEQANHGGISGTIQVMDGDTKGGLVDITELKTSYALNKYKVTTHLLPGYSMAYLNDTDNSKDKGKALGMNKVNVIGPNEIPSSNFIILGTFDTQKEAENYKRYLETKFCRFLIFISITSNEVSMECFRYVPDQENYNNTFTDEELYTKYNLTEKDIMLIESVIKER